MKLANGEELKLTFNMWALIEMEKEFGDLTNAENILGGDNSSCTLQTLINLVRIGANATIKLENLLNNEQRRTYTSQEIALLIGRKQIPELRLEISRAMSNAFAQDFESEPVDEKK